MTEAETAAPREQGRAWSFLVTGDDRQFQGNAGYEDIVEESYSYDSTVSNHQHVAVGDLVVVRNGKEALGVGYVEALQVLPHQEKVRSRCPFCGSTGFKERATMLPRFWCSRCKKAFDDPVVETLSVTAFRAHYGGTWQPLDGCLDKVQLSELSPSRSHQQSIKKMQRHRTLEPSRPGVSVFRVDAKWVEREDIDHRSCRVEADGRSHRYDAARMPSARRWSVSTV